MVWTVGTAAVSAQSGTRDGANAAPTASEKSAAGFGTFATLNGVKATAMSSGELEKVKGLHIHFTTPSQNAGHPHEEPTTGWHFVNHQENNLGKGNAPAISGPGYSGLCGAALKSPSLTIPGQNPATGVGGGCF